MTLTAGARLGPYEIVSPLGAGGMGEVYKARDTRLERTVAIKVLPSHLSENPEVRQRFEREAKTISSLSHPHICGLYDVGHQDGTDFLVMEFVEGETLTERLARGQLPIEQALRYGIEIADALDTAHRQGVVHRDLKPGNVMLTKSGVKLVDFGLAKFAAAGPAASLISATALPTQAPDLTAEGTILGTFQYMAPEQLEGKEADARTDIFALGAVLHEMATGQRAFTGGSRASLIGAILHTQPPLISTIQPLTPPALDRVVRTCLAKDPEDRWRTAHDVRLELKWIAEGSSLPAPMAASPPKSRERLLWLALAILALAALLPWVIRDRKVTRADAAVTRFAVLPPDNASFLGGEIDPVTISPDGRRLALLATSGGRRLIWIRALESLTAEPLPGTEGASYPFWSPDSRFIGFFADGKLKRTEASGGPVQTLCDAPDGRGGAWNRDGVILFAPRQNTESLYRVSSSGGVPVPATRLEPSRQESAHRWPSFLPDGRHFLYLASISTRHSRNGIFLGSLDSKEATLLISADSNVAYSPAGYLLFVRDRTLMAQRFDAERRLAGDVVPVVERMPQNPTSGHSPFSVSENGVLAYWTGDTKKELAWFDQAGRRLGSLGSASDLPDQSLSPDEKRVALARPDARSGASDIWVVDVSRGVSSRLTLDRLEEHLPIWSPDGTRIVFNSNRNGPEDLYQKDSTGTGREELLYKSDVAHKHPLDWSRDGRFILYHTRELRTGSDIMALPLFGNREPIPFLSSEFEERDAQFSPDGRHVAYASDESGVYEIYVQPFPGPGEKLQISTQGGVRPRWRRDGKEIFYVAPDARMMAAPLSPRSGSLSIGNPRALFKTPIIPDEAHASSGYAVTADGQRFLIATPTSETLVLPATVVLNWAVQLDR